MNNLPKEKWVVKVHGVKFQGKGAYVLNWVSGLQISSPWEQGQAA